MIVATYAALNLYNNSNARPEELDGHGPHRQMGD